MKYVLEQTKNKVKTITLEADSMKELNEKHYFFLESLKKENNLAWCVKYFVQTINDGSYLWKINKQK